MQTNQSALEEAPGAHLVPTVIVGIADDKARKCKEEIDRPIPVVDGLVWRHTKISLKEMKTHDQHGRYSAQSVQNFITWF